ncbi:MAG: class II aldolase/adducin family protein [Acetobacterales bacterium]
MSTVARHPGAVDDAERQARCELAAAFRIADHLGWQEGMGNHFSMVVPGHDNHILINPYGLLWEEITASDLVVIDTDGNHVAGERKVDSTARWIHAMCHKAHPEAKVILHTHAPWSTAFTMAEGSVFEFSHQTTMRFYGKIAYDREYHGPGDNKDEGARLASMLGEGNIALFLAAHGVITAGPSVAAALYSMFAIETCCRRQALAKQFGDKLFQIDPEICAAGAKRHEGTSFNARAFLDAHLRRLDRTSPDFRD